MAVAVVFVAFFATVFGVFYLYITTRNRERMSMIDKGVGASLFTPESPVRLKNSTFRFSLKAGCLIIGTGIGLVLSYLLYVAAGPFGSDYANHGESEIFPLVVVGIVFICGGAGLVAGYLIGRKLDRTDFKA